MTERHALLVDIGSTYTKVVDVDLERAAVALQGKSVTTVEEDVTLGLERALSDAGIASQSLGGYSLRLACSSAAGGLSLTAIGLVPELTAEAARRAALGAGAVVRQVYSYCLTPKDIAQIREMEPDIILLVGGTDGGESSTIVHNAALLAKSRIHAPIIVAGNRNAAGRVMEILRREDMDVRLTDNVMPRLNLLNVEPAQEAIREVFLERIVKAKGLDRVQQMLQAVAMPTPSAVLAAARLLADGEGEEDGWGDLLVVDVGGATTDVHSIAEGGPGGTDVIYRGLPEPRLKRTVEGDLGLRINAAPLFAALGESRVRKLMGGSGKSDLSELVDRLSRDCSHIPQSEEEWALEAALGRGAVELAVARHAGEVEELLTPQGRKLFQRGKDLTEVATAIGTGGIFAHHPQAWEMLRGVQTNQDPFLLAPKHAQLCLDRDYIMWAAGLLSDAEPLAALRLLKRCLICGEEHGQT